LKGEGMSDFQVVNAPLLEKEGLVKVIKNKNV
jgi:hypothetical protein